MTHEEKLKYYDVACRLVGYRFQKRNLDLLVSLYELVIEKKGKSTLNDVSDIEFNINEKYKEEECQDKGKEEN